MTYQELFQEQFALKESVMSNRIPKDEIISFGGINLHKDMGFNLFSDEKITLAHTCVHTLFSKKNDFVDNNSVRIIHNKLIVEMRTRSLYHPIFDKLDQKEDKL